MVCDLQADLPHEQDEESEREVGLLHTELEVMNAIEQIHMLQQVDDILYSRAHLSFLSPLYYTCM